MNNLKQLKQELEETKNKCAEIEKKIEELEKQEKVRWRAKNGKTYFTIRSTGNIAQCEEKEDTEYNFDFDHTSRYNFGNYFKTLQEAEKVREKIKIYTRLKDLALKLGRGKKIDWNNSDQPKWCIVLGFFDNTLRSNCNYTHQEIGQIYCLDENFLEVAKEKIGEENLRKLFE